MDGNRQARLVHSLMHPLFVAVVLPSSFAGYPNYAFQWSLVVVVGVPTLILSSTPPDKIAILQYRRVAGIIAMCAAVATVAGLIFGGSLRPSAAGPLAVLVVLLIASGYKVAVPATTTDDRTAVLLSGSFLIGLGTLQTLGIGPVWDLTARFYSAHYPELIGFMRSRAEPVTTSATHSVAACVYAVVSLTASMLSSRATPRRMVFALRTVSVLSWLLILRLHGSTALLSATLVAGIYGLRFSLAIARRKGIRPKIVVRAALLVAIPVISAVGAYFYWLQVNYPSMGLAARFSSAGPYSEIRRLGSRLLLGTGLVEAAGFRYADSGFAKNIVRYGIVGALVLLGCYLIAYREVRRFGGQKPSTELRTALLVIALLGLFEAGNEVLASPRLILIAIGFLSVCRRQFAAGTLPGTPSPEARPDAQVIPHSSV